MRLRDWSNYVLVDLVEIGANVWVAAGGIILCHKRDLTQYKIGKLVMDCPFNSFAAHTMPIPSGNNMSDVLRAFSKVLSFFEMQ